MDAVGYIDDPRGGRLSDYEIRTVEGGHDILLRGPHTIATQIRDCPWPRTYEMRPIDASGIWSHRLHRAGTPDRATIRLLDLLSDVLTVPRCGEARLTLALDFYKAPTVRVDPSSWPNTAAGELVALGKYRSTNVPDRQAECGRILAGAMALVVERHPLLARASAVIAIPGHDAAWTGFGYRLGFSVAAAADIPCMPLRPQYEFRPQAKATDTGEVCRLMTGAFVLEQVAPRVVVIVDDVFRSGETVREAARAVSCAGAQEVSALTAVRTMRR